MKKNKTKIDYVGIALYNVALQHYKEAEKFELALEKHLKLGDLVSPWDCIIEKESYEDLIQLIKDVKKDFKKSKQSKKGK